MRDAREQCRQHLWPQLDLLQAWVLLPHCMQTSASFWARLGFQLGSEVDHKEHKQAMLRSVDELAGDMRSWRRHDRGSEGAVQSSPEL